MTSHRLTRGKVTVELVSLNEGYNGDYDPEDPDDVSLWRFDVYYDGEPVDGCSYCTQVPLTASKAEVSAVLRTIMEAVYDKIVNDESASGICARLSWLDGSGEPVGKAIRVFKPVKRASRKPKRNSRRSKRTSRR